MAPIGKLYTYPNNPRAFKALIAAKYNHVEIELPSFTFGSTNKEASFLQKFPFGKVPAFETADGHCISESNAIAYYVANAKKDSGLLGHTPAEAARVQMFVNIADNEISPAAATWLFPILGFIPYNKENTEKAKASLKKTLEILDSILLTRTYLVGEAPTLADIHIVVALLHLYKMVFDVNFRKSFENVNRYFVTMVNQPEFKAVIGEVSLCEKAAVYDPNNIPKPAPATSAPKAEKPAAAAPAPAKEEKEEEEGEKPQEEAPSGFHLETWKRFYSNNDEKVAIKYFWENIELDKFSVWLCKYKYNDENKLVFMTCNLLGGFFQRCDHLRKIAFASFGVFGADNDNEIHGIWVFQGVDLPEGMLDVADYESYEFTKVTDFNEDNKKNINAFLAWDNIDGLAEFKTVSKPFNQGKLFK